MHSFSHWPLRQQLPRPPTSRSLHTVRPRAASLPPRAAGTRLVCRPTMSAPCDVLASEKLDAGNYTYCSLDSGWSAGYNGDEHGRIIYDDAKFDIPKLADHLHARGLKLGLYVVPGAFQADLNKTILETDTKIGDVCAGDEGLARCVFDYTRLEVQTWHDSVVKQFADW